MVKRALTEAIVFFHRSLCGVCTAVSVEVQLSIPGVLRPALGLQGLKEFQRGTHLYLGHPFKVAFPQGILNVVPARAAAAVSVTEGDQEIFQMPLLHPLFPNAA